MATNQVTTTKLTITRNGIPTRYNYPSPAQAMRFVEACLSLGYVNEKYVITHNGAVVYQYPQ